MPWLVLLACKSPIVGADYLAVTSLSPPDDASGVAVDPEILATFNGPIVAQSIDDTTVSLLANDGTPIALDVSYVEGDNVVVATPLESLEYDAAHTFVISASVEGVETGPMPGDVLTRFRTGEPGPGPDNLAPIANAGSDAIAISVGVDFLLDGTASYDPEGQPVDYRWRVVSRPLGSSAFVEVPDAAETVLRPDLSGTYRLGLVVNDGFNDSEEATVEIGAIEQ
jgi:hypothetical protein